MLCPLRTLRLHTVLIYLPQSDGHSASIGLVQGRTWVLWPNSEPTRHFRAPKSRDSWRAWHLVLAVANASLHVVDRREPPLLEVCDFAGCYPQHVFAPVGQYLLVNFDYHLAPISNLGGRDFIGWSQTAHRARPEPFLWLAVLHRGAQVQTVDFW